MNPLNQAKVALRRFWAIVMATLIIACGSDRYEPGQASDVLGIAMDSVRRHVARQLDSLPRPSWVRPDDWKRVRSMYALFGDAPLWLEEDGVSDRASALLEALRDAPNHALSTAAYPVDSVRRVVDADKLAKRASSDAIAAADVTLSAAYVAYATDMLRGQVDPTTASQAWHISTSRAEIDSALARTLQSPSMSEGLAAMAPQESGYVALRREYFRYRAITMNGGWLQIGSDSRPSSGILATRLRIEGYTPDTAYAGVRAALQQYQELHGLTATGRPDAATLRALNVPAEERLHQIATNLERYRWLPRSLGSRYVVVNVPAFRLEAYDSTEKKLEMKVVVGAEYDGRATPVFSDSMEFVVFRPYWNVTPDIAAKEFFPRYGTNLPPGYETWRENGELRIRQRPGENNSLGLVKFMFPNDFNIYLHDTPEKSLFARADRAASHGCIRLERPDALAEFVLGWSNDRVRAAMKGSDNRTVSLPRRIPVYIVYFTAYVRNGQLHFADDLYQRDEPLDDSLHGTDSARGKSVRPSA